MPFNRRQFVTHTGAASAAGMLAANAGDNNAAAGHADQGSGQPDPDRQIMPVGGRSISGSGDPVALAPPDDQPPNLQLPEVPERKIGWAIVGLGTLALNQILPAFRQCKLSEPRALVSGHRKKAETVARAYGIDSKSIYDYESYDKIANDPSIDVIYIVLPNSMHAEYTIRGLKAGKHVLCEKPMASSIADCQKMIAAADEAKRKLMIAYRLHYDPFNQAVMRMCEAKKLGEIKTFAGNFCINVKAPNIRLSHDLAGGPVGDVGVYPINASRYVTGEEPEQVSALVHQPKDDPRFREVPESVSCTMQFPSGILATINCSFGTHRDDFFHVACTEGTIQLSPAFSYSGQRLVTDEPGKDGGPPRIIEHDIKPKDQFASEMDHFSNCILNNHDPRTPGAEGLADIKVLDAIDRSIRSGKAEKVG